MKKVMLYIGSMQYGGAQRVVANIINYLVLKEYDVILINDNYPSKTKEEYNFNERVKRFFLKPNNKGFVRKNINMLFNYRKIIKAEKPDIILSFMGSPNIRTILSTIGLKVKKIVSVRNDPFEEYGYGLKRFFARIILNMADGCVFQTEDAKKYFKKGLQKKSRVILNPVNNVFYETKRDNNVNNIVTIGRLEKQKNHKLLIDAYIRIHDKINKEKLIIYGEGSLRKELEEYIKENKMEGKILLPGAIKDVNNKLASAKLFVLSSDYEGMPNALMEAMAVGVPVISTNCPCGGPKNLIISDDQGILVPCNNVDELSKKILLLINDKELLHAMSVGAKNRAVVFKSDIILNEWEKYINSI